MNKKETLQSLFIKRFFITFALPLIIVGGIFTYITLRREINKTIDDNQIAANNISNIISVDLKRGKEFLYGVSATFSTEDTTYRSYLEKVTKNTEFSRLFDIFYILDTNGAVKWSSRVSHNKVAPTLNYSGVTFRHKEFFKKARESNKSTWSETYTSLITGERTVTNIIPHSDGYIAADIDLKRLLHTISQIKKASYMNFAILDKYGNYIFHPKENSLYKYSRLPILHSSKDSVTSFQYREENRLLMGSAAPIAESNWILVVFQDRSKAMSGVKWLTGLLLTLFIVMFLIALYTSIASSKRIKKRLAYAIARAEDVGNGTYNLPVVSVDLKEFQILNNSIDLMAQAVAERESALKQAQEYTEAQNVFQQRLLDSISIPVFVCSREGEILLVNNACKTFLGEDKNRLFSLLNGTEETIQFLDNQPHDVLIQTSHVSTPEGDTLSVVSVIDITERLKLENKLHHSEKLQAIGQLAGGIAHDFNNQLAGILGFAQVLQNDMPKESKQFHHLQAIIDAVTQSSDITHQLLAFSRQGKYTLREIDLNELVLSVAEMLKHTISRKITLVVKKSAAPLIIMADQSQIQNAVLNLGINARDAIGDENGEITLEVASHHITEPTHFYDNTIAAGLYGTISVSDTGCGIDTKTKEHIFEPFFTTKAEGKGTGMGLAAVLGTVTTHKGFIDIDSDSDKGTRFVLHLPLVEKEIKPPQSKTAELPKNPESGLTVLVIDDEPTIRLTTSHLLKSQGMSCLLAENGKIGLELFLTKKKEIDIVLLDVNMPAMNGYETFNELRKINPHLPILIITGYADEERLRNLLSQNRCDYISKPFSLPALMKKIDTLMK